MPLKTIPKVIQLPGGHSLQVVAFKIIERFPDGTPKLFEILPHGENPLGEDRCGMFCEEIAIRDSSFGRGTELSTK